MYTLPSNENDRTAAPQIENSSIKWPTLQSFQDDQGDENKNTQKKTIYLHGVPDHPIFVAMLWLSAPLMSLCKQQIYPKSCTNPEGRQTREKKHIPGNHGTKQSLPMYICGGRTRNIRSSQS